MITLTEQALTVVCVTSFASKAGDCQRGELYRQTDPRVLAVPQHFRPADTPVDEWPTDFDIAIATTEAREKALEAERRQGRIDRANRNPVRLEAPATLRAVRDVLDLSNGRKVLKGSTVLSTDELVTEGNPSDWKLV